MSRISSGALVILLVALPIANAASAVRHADESVFRSEITYLLPLFVATLCFSLFTTIMDSSRSGNPIWPRQIGGGIFVSLLAWLLLSYFRVWELDAARNMAVILLTFIALIISTAQGIAVGPLFRTATRLSVLYSMFMYLLHPVWYVNAGQYFEDSGKIVSTLPNVQGILSHSNLTALYFGSALVVEIALWGHRSRTQVSALFAVMSLIILFTAQGRNAILATALAIACVLCYQHGKAVWASVALIVAFVASWVPFALMARSFFFGGTPNYAWLSAVTNRGALWTGIAKVLPDSFLWGHGSAAIAQAHRFVLAREVTAVNHAHNQILNLLLVGGVPAAILFSGLFCAIASRIRSGRAPAEGVGLIIILAVTTITESPLAPYVTQVSVVLFILSVTLLFSSQDSDAGQCKTGCRSPSLGDRRGKTPQIDTHHIGLAQQAVTLPSNGYPTRQ